MTPLPIKTYLVLYIGLLFFLSILYRIHFKKYCFKDVRFWGCFPPVYLHTFKSSNMERQNGKQLNLCLSLPISSLSPPVQLTPWHGTVFLYLNKYLSISWLISSYALNPFYSHNKFF